MIRTIDQRLADERTRARRIDDLAKPYYEMRASLRLALEDLEAKKVSLAAAQRKVDDLRERGAVAEEALCKELATPAGAENEK